MHTEERNSFQEKAHALTLETVQTLFQDMLHDLASPLGALTMGTDLLDPKTPDLGDIIDIVQKTSAQMRIYLDYFRNAFSLKASLSKEDFLSVGVPYLEKRFNARCTFKNNIDGLPSVFYQATFIACLWRFKKNPIDCFTIQKTAHGLAFSEQFKTSPHAIHPTTKKSRACASETLFYHFLQNHNLKFIQDPTNPTLWEIQS